MHLAVSLDNMWSVWLCLYRKPPTNFSDEVINITMHGLTVSVFYLLSGQGRGFVTKVIVEFSFFLNYIFPKWCVQRCAND